MRVAALDLGSNSFLLFVAEVIKGEIKEVLHDEQKVTRLAQGVHQNREFHPEALARAEGCFAYYKTIIDKFNVKKVKAVSTSAARDVNNKKEFLNLGLKYGIPIDIIPGVTEAELTYKGTVDLGDENSSIIDIGGGSTEIIGLDNQNQIKGWSLDIGSVRLTEMFNAFDKVSDSQLEKIDNYILEQINKHKNRLPKITKALAVAGTPTTLSCLIQKSEFSTEKVDGYILTKNTIDEMRIKLAHMTLEERKNLAGIHPKRADVLVCGVSILKNICDHFNLNNVEVSCRGVRYGLARTMA